MIATDGAKQGVRDGNVYDFCSYDCREIFATVPVPDLYVAQRDARQDKPPKNLEHSHA